MSVSNIQTIGNLAVGPGFNNDIEGEGWTFPFIVKQHWSCLILGQVALVPDFENKLGKATETYILATVCESCLHKKG